MKTQPRKQTSIAFFLLIVAVIALAGFAAAANLDFNRYRGAIEAALSREIGHDVKLNGDIRPRLSPRGVVLKINDASFGNPPWASRPDLAIIKSLDLDIRLLPLLSNHIYIDGFTLENADILLESQDETHHNWDSYADAAPISGETSPVEINTTRLSIINSRIAVRGAGSDMVFKADKLTLGSEGEGIGLRFAGSLNDLPVALSVLTNGDSLRSTAPRPIDIKLDLDNYHLTAEGRMDAGNKRIDLANYEITTGASEMAGHLAASWVGARPAMQGVLMGDDVLLSDLKFQHSGAEAGADPSRQIPAALKHIFSADPLPFDDLKFADMNMDMAFAMLRAGSTRFQNIRTTLLINNGHMFVSPLSMNLGAGIITGQVNLDASQSPARLGASFSADDVDLSDIVKAWGAESFLTGKVKADVNLASSGNSLHELAGNLNGPINLIGAGGDVITTTKNVLSAGLMNILAPGSGNPHDGMNCLVARFIALNGDVKGNGILIDTAMATAAGFGDVDLRSETIDLDFHAKPKGADVAALLPVMHIGGTLLSPAVNFDGKSIVQNMGQLLTGGAADDPVPDLATQQGQNACAYALDHPVTPAAQEAAKTGAAQKVVGKAKNLIKGLLGN